MTPLPLTAPEPRAAAATGVRTHAGGCGGRATATWRGAEGQVCPKGTALIEPGTRVIDALGRRVGMSHPWPKTRPCAPSSTPDLLNAGGDGFDDKPIIRPE